MKKESKFTHAITTMLGAGGGSIAGGTIQDERYRRLAEQGAPASPQKHIAEVMKGLVVGGTLGAGLGLGAGSKLSKMKLKRLQTLPRKKTKTLVNDIGLKQQSMHKTRMSMSKHFSDFPEFASTKKINSKIKMTPEKATNLLASEKGLSYKNMSREYFDDVQSEVIAKIKKGTGFAGRKRAKEFKKAWATRGYKDRGVENFVNYQTNKKWGINKVAQMSETEVVDLMNKTAARYQDQRYKTQLRDTTLKDRAKSGIIGAGIPSAVLTGGIGILSGAKKPVKWGLGIGAVASGFGAVMVPKKKRIFVPVNEKTAGARIDGVKQIGSHFWKATKTLGVGVKYNAEIGAGNVLKYTKKHKKEIGLVAGTGLATTGGMKLLEKKK